MLFLTLLSVIILSSELACTVIRICSVLRCRSQNVKPLWFLALFPGNYINNLFDRYLYINVTDVQTDLVSNYNRNIYWSDIPEYPDSGQETYMTRLGWVLYGQGRQVSSLLYYNTSEKYFITIINFDENMF